MACNFEYTYLKNEPHSVVNWYPDTTAFFEYRAIDMVPERHWEYFQGTDNASGYGLFTARSKVWEPGKNGPKDARQKMQLGECEVPAADGGGWVVQRMGPFVSNGGSDFWQVGLRDAFRLSKVLKRHPEGIFATTSFTGAVLGNGQILGYPPIHMHHIHIVTQPGVKRKLPACNRTEPGMREVHCYTYPLALEQHGDYQCMPQQGGVNCFFERPAGGHVKELHDALDLEGEINDVRPAGSAPMTWWYQLAVRWHPKNATEMRGARPVSQIFVVGPGKKNESNQLSELGVFPLDTKESSLFWYSGVTFNKGELVRLKPHSHNAMYVRSFWFRASPEDLGLRNGARDLVPKWRACAGPIAADPMEPCNMQVPVRLREAGFRDFDEAEAYLMENLATAKRGHAKLCAGDGASRRKSSFLSSSSAAGSGASAGQQSCEGNPPFVVCRAWRRIVHLDDGSGRNLTYDRRAKICCNPWSWRPGEIWTTVAFFSPMTGPSPGGQIGGGEAAPAYYPQHVHWIQTYRGPESRLGRSFYSMFTDDSIAGDSARWLLQRHGSWSPFGLSLAPFWIRWPDGLHDVKGAEQVVPEIAAGEAALAGDDAGTMEHSVALFSSGSHHHRASSRGGGVSALAGAWAAAVWRIFSGVGSADDHSATVAPLGFVLMTVALAGRPFCRRRLTRAVEVLCPPPCFPHLCVQKVQHVQ